MTEGKWRLFEAGSEGVYIKPDTGNIWDDMKTLAMFSDRNHAQLAVLAVNSHSELVKALEVIYACVSDKLRAQLDDESLVPMDVTSIPVLYGTLRLIRAALTAAGGKG